MIAKRYLFFGLALIASSCGKKEPNAELIKPKHVITGQVFVIQKNRLNVKLGGVDIFYIPQAEFRKRCSWISAQHNRALEVKSYKEKMEKIDGWLTDVAVAPSAAKLQSFISNSSNYQETAHTRFRSNPEIIEFEKIEHLRNSNSELFENSGISSNETCQWIATCFYFDWLDRSSAYATKTDADGNFALTINKSSPGVIMMNSSRQLVGGSFENFYWMKEVSGDETDPVIFSSKETVTGGFLMETVRQASEPKRCSQKIIQDEMNLVDLEWFSNAQSIFTTISGADQQITNLDKQILKLDQLIKDIRYDTEP